MISSHFLGAAFFAGLTVARGGLLPVERMFFNLLLVAAALTRVVEARKAGEPLRFAWPLLFPLAASLVSMGFAPIPNLAVYPVGELCLIIVVSGLFSGRAFPGPVIPWIVGGAALLAASMVLESSGHVRVLGRVGLGLQPGGLLGGATASAIVLAATVPLLIRMKLERKWPASLFAGPLVLFAAAFILAGSRTAYIAVCCGLMIPLARLPRPIRVRAIFILLAVLSAAIAIYLPRFVAKLNLDYMTNQQRISMARAVWEMIGENPWFGFGPGSFAILAQKHLSYPKWELHPHGLFLRVLFENGALGVVGWGMMILLVLRAYFRRRKAHPYTLAALAAFLGGSFTDDILWIPAAALFFFLAAGEILDRYQKRIPSPALFAVLPIVFLWASLPLAHSTWSGLPLRPISHQIDEAIQSDRCPDYGGWELDPIALRVAGYQNLDSGDTTEAERLFRSAAKLDPLMLFAPHELDLARLLSRGGRETEAMEIVAEVSRKAPVLAAWFRGDTGVPARWSYLDRHYRLEFIDPYAVDLFDLPFVGDPLDWTLYRYRGGELLERGDTRGARIELEKSLYLARLNHGHDPVLYRMLRIATGDEFWGNLADKTRGPVLPWRYYAALIYRIAPETSGDNSDWWPTR